MRKADIARKTNEVDITGEFVIDGKGIAVVKTPFEPLNHILTLFAFHGFFDLKIDAKGDLAHHIIEDLGIACGKAFKAALGEKEGIVRYGSFSLAMDKVLVEASVDISGRPSVHGVPADIIENTLRFATFDDTNFKFEHAQEFLESFCQHAGLSIVYVIKSAEGDLHHILEALFKALGKALDQATAIDPRRVGVPSTKGVID
jgi:imidazoleglycerol-phosphate dehydratase